MQKPQANLPGNVGQPQEIHSESASTWSPSAEWEARKFKSVGKSRQLQIRNVRGSNFEVSGSAWIRAFSIKHLILDCRRLDIMSNSRVDGAGQTVSGLDLPRMSDE